MIFRPFIKNFVSCVLFFGVTISSWGQNVEIVQNLEIVLDTTFTNLKIGQAFAVTGRVQSTGNTDIPAGQTIKATVEFVSPDGMIVQSHQQLWNGFPEQGNAPHLRNNSAGTAVIFQFLSIKVL